MLKVIVGCLDIPSKK